MTTQVPTTSCKLGIAPGRFPSIRHPLQMLTSPLEFLTSLRDAGDLVKVRLGTEWAYFVRHPDLLRQVLLGGPQTFDKGGPFFDKAQTVAGNGILTCPGKDHARQRRMMQPLFSRERLVRYAAVMHEEAERVAASWRPGQQLSVNKAMSALTLAVTTRTLFSTEAPAGIVAEAQDALIVIFAGLYRRMIVPLDLVHDLPTPDNRRFDQAVTRLPEIIDQIIERYRRAGIDHGDLLSTLLAARDPETGEGLSDRELREQVMALFTAGTETTASALTSTFYLLDRHPDVERRLHAEADAVLHGRAARHEDLEALDYTTRVFTETLRLYPPGWILTRRTNAAVDLGGHRVPAGATILFSPYALHRDPEFFTDPERFDPDRWLPDRAKAVPRFAMLPFSAGQRKCMGDTFAMNMATIILATLAGRWRLRSGADTKVRSIAKMTLSVEATPMRVEARAVG
ncbi:cytochrome P450 [Minicystis rosea]|nr:cytochrome P450 [Minicystis rosea]